MQATQLESALVPLLSTFIAFGVITVAANALANFAGIKIHERAENNNSHELFYDSDAAQELREYLYRFPSRMTGTYIICLILVTFIGWVALSGIQNQKDVDNLLVGIPVMALVYMVIVVILTSYISKRLFKVLQETQGDQGSAP